MTQPTVYLAGPIAGLDYAGAVGWREQATEDLFAWGVKALSPMRAKQYLRDVTEFTGHCRDEGSEGPLSSARSVVARDRFDVLRADVILVNLVGATRISIGTMFEMAWAMLNHKPVVLAMEPGNVHEHAFVGEAAGFRVETLSEALRVTRAILL